MDLQSCCVADCWRWLRSVHSATLREMTAFHILRGLRKHRCKDFHTTGTTSSASIKFVQSSVAQPSREQQLPRGPAPWLEASVSSHTVGSQQARKLGRNHINLYDTGKESAADTSRLHHAACSDAVGTIPPHGFVEWAADVVVLSLEWI